MRAPPSLTCPPRSRHCRRCDVRTFGSALPGGTCLLSHDAKKSQGARMVTITSGPAVNWTCGYLAPGGSNGTANNASSGSATRGRALVALVAG